MISLKTYRLQKLYPKMSFAPQWCGAPKSFSKVGLRQTPAGRLQRILLRSGFSISLRSPRSPSFTDINIRACDTPPSSCSCEVRRRKEHRVAAAAPPSLTLGAPRESPGESHLTQPLRNVSGAWYQDFQEPLSRVHLLVLTHQSSYIPNRTPRSRTPSFILVLFLPSLSGYLFLC
jgi:hypothetical protein